VEVRLHELDLSLDKGQPRQRSRYRDWLCAERPRGRSSGSGCVKDFHFAISSRPAPGFIQSPIQRVPEDLSLGIKRLEREADHSPSTSAEIKKSWVYTSTTPNAFMA
jgi:hypothetical protein